MLKRILHTISAERTDIDNFSLLPTFYQHQKAYSYSQKYVKGKSVLEIGSGSGFGAYRLSKDASSYVAVDNDSLSITKARRKFNRDNLTFLLKDIRDYSPKRKFDVIISFQVIEHLKNPEVFLEKISNLLKRDGILLITTPNSITQSYNENPYYAKEFTNVELKNFLLNYFNHVQTLGLNGDSFVKKYEKRRKDGVVAILKKDKYRLRKLIPIKIRQRLFDLSSYYSRKILDKKIISHSITEDNYYWSKNTNSAIDLLAICSQQV